MRGKASGQVFKTPCREPSWAASRVLSIALILTVLFAVNSPAASTGYMKVSFYRDGDQESCAFKAEPAVTEEEQALGLMFRPALGPDEGMLFISERDEVRSFWMRNTLIPLDMIFITSALKVAHVHRSAKPGDETAISSRLPVQYVLEVNAGKAASCRIREGTKVRFINEPR